MNGNCVINILFKTYVINSQSPCAIKYLTSVFVGCCWKPLYKYLASLASKYNLIKHRLRLYSSLYSWSHSLKFYYLPRPFRSTCSKSLAVETFRGVRGSIGISAKVFERIKVHFYKREACPPRRFAVALYTKMCLSRVTGLFRQ